MARNLYAVLVTFGPAHRDGALEALRRTASRLCPERKLLGVVVDNAQGGNLEIELDGAFTCVSGDNSQHEFSGWDRGLQWLDSVFRAADGDLLLLGNDTLHRSYGRAWLDGFAPSRLAEAVGGGGLLGWVDAYPSEVSLFGRPLRRWLRTNLVAGSRAVVDGLRPFALPYADDELFTSDLGQLFRSPSPLSDNYRRYLRTWLFGEPGDGDFRERWHSAAPLTSQNVAAFRAKIRSILCEHHLGARARGLGVPLVDVRD
jgi:hypothetical protein